MAVNEHEQQTVHSPSHDGVQSKTELSHNHQLGLSRRNLLKGAAIAGGSLAAVGSAAFAMKEATTHAAGVQPMVQIATSGKLREYWIQADSFFHNLVPTGYDGLMGMNFTPSDSSYWALGYRAYTPGWGKPLTGNTDIGANTGIPGPILRGEVGDTIRIHFRNNDRHEQHAHSMHPHGVMYTPNNDGAWFAADPRPGSVVGVGQSYTYEWIVRPNSVGTWVYHDHSLPVGQTMQMELGAERGLFGFLVLTSAATSHVDKEFFTFFHDIYQADIPELSQDYDCFSGYSYVGNTQTFHARVGDKIRWHIGALGVEFHVFHTHGHRWLSPTGQFVDTTLLGPSMATSFDITMDNPGKWLYHCHVNDHMMGGMVGMYIVTL